MTFCVNEFLKCSSSVSFFLPLRLLRVPFYLPQLSGESSSLDGEIERGTQGGSAMANESTGRAMSYVSNQNRQKDKTDKAWRRS